MIAHQSYEQGLSPPLRHYPSPQSVIHTDAQNLGQTGEGDGRGRDSNAGIQNA